MLTIGIVGLPNPSTTTSLRSIGCGAGVVKRYA